MRIRREAKIFKNHRREYVWVECSTEEGEPFVYPKSRYKPNRVWIAHQRLVKAMRRRYRNNARRAFKEDGYCLDYKYYNHMACDEYNMFEHACRWWNIPE